MDVFVFKNSIVLSTNFFLLRKQKMTVLWELDLDSILFPRKHIGSQWFSICSDHPSNLPSKKRQIRRSLWKETTETFIYLAHTTTWHSNREGTSKKLLEEHNYVLFEIAARWTLSKRQWENDHNTDLASQCTGKVFQRSEENQFLFPWFCLPSSEICLFDFVKSH